MVMTWFKKFLLSSCDPWANQDNGHNPKLVYFDECSEFTPAQWEALERTIRAKHDPRCDVDPIALTWRRDIAENEIAFVCVECRSKIGDRK